MNDENFYFGRLNNVSVNELDAALANTIGITAHARARHMFSYISNRKMESTPREDLAALRLAEAGSEYNPTFKFTARELDESLQRVGFIPWVGLPAILKDIKDHREPEWKARDIVTDINRSVYIMQDSGRWKSVQYGMFVPFDKPMRPLKKIGVEGL
jgi:hypothetical protein